MIAFSIGSFGIHRYGIFYLVACIVGYFFLKYLAKTNLFAERPSLQRLLEKDTDDIIVYSIIGILVGGRLGHVFIYDFGNYIAHPLNILAIRQGGMSFIGGMIGVSLSLLLLKKSKKLNRTDFLLLLDCILAIVPFGIMLGRIGNFLNQELYGIIVPNGARGLGQQILSFFHAMHIFHVYPAIDTLTRINTNLISSLIEGGMILVVTLTSINQWIKKKTYHAGRITGIFLVLYSTARFFLEYIRQDSQSEFTGAFTKSQRFFIVFFLLGIFFFFKEKIGISQRDTK